MKDPYSYFRGKRVTVMGLGLLGRGLNDTLFLVRSGARVTVTDLKTEEQLAESLDKLRDLPVTLKLGGHREEDFIETDMVLRNADVPRHSRFLGIAREHNVPVEMDESLFCKLFPGNVIGITGTRGKTTTSTLVHHILNEHGIPVYLAGNIVGKATLPLLEIVEPGHVVVLELSSWQLQGFHDARLSPNISVFTNIYPDHLNRYNGMEDYIADKKAIYQYQKDGDLCLFNGDREQTRALADEAPARVDFFSPRDVPRDWKVGLPGDHNLENVAAAMKPALELRVPLDTIRAAVESFPGVPHRLQKLGSINGVEFVNDSTSTTPTAGCAALQTLGSERTLLIAGGSDKKLDLTPFAEAAVDTKAVALLSGTATPELARLIIEAGGRDVLVGTFDNLDDAVEELLRRAVPGDIILLSPGCASFGMFKNEYDRGDTFIRIFTEKSEQ